jgi:IPT/TIG domain
MPEKKDSYPATASEPKQEATNQQVVQVLLDLLKEAQQRTSSATTVELDPDVERDVAFGNAMFALIEGGLKMQTVFALTSISPTEGIPKTGGNVTITGTNCVPPATVTFDDAAAKRPATDVKVLSATEIQATAPSVGSGVAAVTVVVTTPGGTASRPYRYIP